MLRKILIGLLGILIVIQFIRPERNVSNAASPNAIERKFVVPPNVKQILTHSCYDCHSNNTNYPWYTNIQPIGLWLHSHVVDGKRHLNFDEFASYSEKKASHQFGEIEDAATNGWMPLTPYVMIHNDTKLDPQQAKVLADWAASLK